ncbi:uncharacterized protein B0I36DRAFT_426527 [Microdochium trichocladiopsis]|uniref:Uncharacterized protein n=1 Tax=Microdochium trichocladiopsis TaxID=1682393 RepID=A0A9P8YGH7_9PEZI|nr:uncharacterized protein B0I36DRAFT_426527 [Microdochium trichocladiopsis]KAH7039964.1 hypothetical protein B0I36DRAFT_426527 [Microdochium trichocladiopsis]
MSGQQETARSASSNSSIDSKLHALPLKQHPQNRLKLFPTRMSGPTNGSESSHLILSPNGLQPGLIDHPKTAIQLSGTTTDKLAIQKFHPARIWFANVPIGEALLTETGRNNESRSSSYQTAFTHFDTLRIKDGNPSRHWWQTPNDDTPIEPESASFKQRESELLSIATRFPAMRKPPLIGAPVVSKFREDLGSNQRLRENKTPMLAKIQSLLMSKSQRRRESCDDPAYKAQRLVRPPTPGFVLNREGDPGNLKKVRPWRKFVGVNYLGVRPASVQQQSLPWGVEIKATGAQTQLWDKDPVNSSSESHTAVVAAPRRVPDTTTQRSLHVTCHELSAEQTRQDDELQQAKTNDVGCPQRLKEILSTPKRSFSVQIASVPGDTELSHSLQSFGTAQGFVTTRTQSLLGDKMPRFPPGQQEEPAGGGTSSLKRSKSSVEHRVSVREARPDKFMTWHSAPARQQILFESTLEFGVQLEKALADAKLMVLQ